MRCGPSVRLLCPSPTQSWRTHWLFIVCGRWDGEGEDWPFVISYAEVEKMKSVISHVYGWLSESIRDFLLFANCSLVFIGMHRQPREFGIQISPGQRLLSICLLSRQLSCHEYISCAHCRWEDKRGKGLHGHQPSYAEVSLTASEYLRDLKRCYRNSWMNEWMNEWG